VDCSLGPIIVVSFHLALTPIIKNLIMGFSPVNPFYQSLRDKLCFEILGVWLRYCHLQDGSIFTFGFVYEEGDDIFRKANMSNSLTNLGILSQQRWRSGILSVHFIFLSKKQASNTSRAEGPHYQALFVDFVWAMKKYLGPAIWFVFYSKPTVNHLSGFLS
jgi:hypothetical protein